MIACFLTPKIGIYCERARRTGIARKPLALIDEQSRVVAVSPDAEAAGVRTGQSVSGASALCRGLLTLPYDRPAYETTAAKVWDLIARESSFVEPVSPEQCYATLDNTRALAQAHLLIRQIGGPVGRHVQVGLGRLSLAMRHRSARWAHRATLGR